jgi:hypothetical protein
MGVDAISEALESRSAKAPSPEAWVLVVGSVDRRLARGLGQHVVMHVHTTDLVLPRDSFELAIWVLTADVPAPDALVEIRNALARDGVLLVIDAERALDELDEQARNAGFSRRQLRRTAAGFSVLELLR